MFANVERRLAILNVSVVIAIVALIGAGTWVLLSRSLDREADTSLEMRIQSARDSLVSLPTLSPSDPVETTVTPTPSSSDDDDEDHGEEDDEDEHKEDREIVVSGDTLVFIFDNHGDLVGNRRNVVLEHIPDEAGVSAALEGDTDTRFVTVEGERIRIRTEPIYHDNEVVGAIQAVRSEAEHDDELSLLRNVTLIGTGVGVLIAVPAGIYLTRRAMTPINDVLQRQQSFVSNAAHELRTPLTVLRANTELMARTPNLDRIALDRDLRAMITDIDSMSQLVDGLLELSRVENPESTIKLQDVPLQPEIEHAMKMLSPLASLGDVTMRYHGENILVHAAPGVVGQVLRITLENAIKYTPAGGRIDIFSREQGNLALIEIRDTGIGIASEEMPYLFDRFYRGDKARTRSGGTGLGLSIARGLVTLLGGTITLESTLGEGTIVRVTLPLAVN